MKTALFLTTISISTVFYKIIPALLFYLIVYVVVTVIYNYYFTFLNIHRIQIGSTFTAIVNDYVGLLFCLFLYLGNVYEYIWIHSSLIYHTHKHHSNNIRPT